MSYYSCTCWQGRVPAQGYIYLTVPPSNHPYISYPLSLGDSSCLLRLYVGYRDEGISYGQRTAIVFVLQICTKVIVRWTDVTDIQKKAGLLQETVKVSTMYEPKTSSSRLQHRSESWVFSMYNGECYDLISQLANLGMRKLISEDSYHQVLIFHF